MKLADSGASRTDWSMIVQAAGREGDAAADALERLVRRYWSAIYAYIRRSGRDVHEAADLTQSFVTDVVIGRSLCGHADPRRGRFRTLLLSAVKNYLREHWRKEQHIPGFDKRARRPAAGSAEYTAGQVGSEETPDEAFSRHWSATLVRHVLARVQSECRADGLDSHWTVFEHRVVRPMLFTEPPTEYGVLVDRLNLKDEAQAANMMITVKRRFARALQEEIGDTVSDPEHADEELHDLLRDLERKR